MGHLTPEAHDLFATQHGVASVEQLLEARLTRREIKRLEGNGAVVNVIRGVYRSASVDLDEFGRSAAVCLARPDVSIAGPTAGRLWEFRRLPRDLRTHVLGPPASNPAIAPWVATYRTAAFHPHDVIQRRDGIRLTSRARTAFDLARWLGADDLLSVIEQAAHDGRLDRRDLYEVAFDWLSPQRPWASKYLRQLARRLDGSAAESHPEVRVASALGRCGVTELVRQHRVRLPGYGDARFDLAVPRLYWAIEIDVHPTHEETVGAARDVRRDRAAAVGWRVSRVRRCDYHDAFDRTVVDLVDLFRRLDLEQSLAATAG